MSAPTLKTLDAVMRDIYVPAMLAELERPLVFYRSLHTWPKFVPFPRINKVEMAVKRRRYLIRSWYNDHVLDAIDVLRHGRRDDW